MRRADRDRPAPPEVSFRVRCGGRLHTVRLTSRGRLALDDHRGDGPEVFATEALLEEKCRCRQVLDAWRRGVGSVPKELADALRAAGDRRSRRRFERADPSRAADRSPGARLAARVRDLVVASWEESTYRRATQSRWVPGSGSFAEVALAKPAHGTPPGVSAVSEVVWAQSKKKRSGTRQRVTLRCHPSGHVALRRAMGLPPLTDDGRTTTFADGGDRWLALGLAAAEDEKERRASGAGRRMVVWTGRQGRGCAVLPARAIIERDGDGWRLVRWLPA